MIGRQSVWKAAHAYTSAFDSVGQKKRRAPCCDLSAIQKSGFFLVVITCQVLPACSGSLPRDVDTQPHHAAVPKARDGGSYLQGSHPIIV